MLFLCRLGNNYYFCGKKPKVMDLLHIIAVVALVIIGVVIYLNKRNG